MHENGAASMDLMVSNLEHLREAVRARLARRKEGAGVGQR